MIASELAQRYEKGESLTTLAREYQIGPHKVARLVRRMGGVIRPVGTNGRPSISPERALAANSKARDKRLTLEKRCARCEILLSASPQGNAGMCGWCIRGE